MMNYFDPVDMSCYRQCHLPRPLIMRFFILSNGHHLLLIYQASPKRCFLSHCYRNPYLTFPYIRVAYYLQKPIVVKIEGSRRDFLTLKKRGRVVDGSIANPQRETEGSKQLALDM